MKRVGERIKTRRQNNHMQLTELSKKVGVTVSCLSQIENGKSFPSILTLKHIADELNSTVGALIGEEENLNRNPLMKAGDKKFVKKNRSGASVYLLSHHGSNKMMEVYLMEFGKGASSGSIMKEHPGQEFCYAVKGHLEIELNENKYILKKGDGIYFNSSVSHVIKNIDKLKSEIIWVVTPPNI